MTEYLILATLGWLIFIIGMVVGAWWQSRPISDLEKRVELDSFEEDL